MLDVNDALRRNAQDFVLAVFLEGTTITAIIHNVAVAGYSIMADATGGLGRASVAAAANTVKVSTVAVEHALLPVPMTTAAIFPVTPTGTKTGAALLPAKAVAVATKAGAPVTHALPPDIRPVVQLGTPLLPDLHELGALRQELPNVPLPRHAVGVVEKARVAALDILEYLVAGQLLGRGLLDGLLDDGVVCEWLVDANVFRHCFGIRGADGRKYLWWRRADTDATSGFGCLSMRSGLQGRCPGCADCSGCPQKSLFVPL